MDEISSVPEMTNTDNILKLKRSHEIKIDRFMKTASAGKCRQKKWKEGNVETEDAGQKPVWKIGYTHEPEKILKPCVNIGSEVNQRSSNRVGTRIYPVLESVALTSMKSSQVQRIVYVEKHTCWTRWGKDKTQFIVGGYGTTFADNRLNRTQNRSGFFSESIWRRIRTQATSTNAQEFGYREKHSEMTRTSRNIFE